MRFAITNIVSGVSSLWLFHKCLLLFEMDSPMSKNTEQFFLSSSFLLSLFPLLLLMHSLLAGNGSLSRHIYQITITFRTSPVTADLVDSICTFRGVTTTAVREVELQLLLLQKQFCSESMLAYPAHLPLMAAMGTCRTPPPFANYSL